MSNFNKVVLIGRLTKNPQVVEASGGKVTFLNIAVNRNYTNNKGEKVEEVTFIDDIVAFGKIGENIAKYLEKGRCVLLEGRLQTKKKENQSKLGVVVDNFVFLDSTKQQASS